MLYQLVQPRHVGVGPGCQLVQRLGLVLTIRLGLYADANGTVHNGVESGMVECGDTGLWLGQVWLGGEIAQGVRDCLTGTKDESEIDNFRLEPNARLNGVVKVEETGWLDACGCAKQYSQRMWLFPYQFCDSHMFTTRISR